MYITPKFPFSRSNMSSVRQHPIYFIPVFLFIFVLAPATEGIIVFILSSDILYPLWIASRSLCLVEEIWIVDGNWGGTHRLGKLYFVELPLWWQIVLNSLIALGFKAGKDNITTITPGLFACKVIYYPRPFYGGQQVTVLASVGHTAQSQTPRSGAAVWVEDVTASEFTVCVLEFGNGSNRTLEVNWLSFQAPLRGSQIGTASLNSWTAGTKCKRIDYQQVSIAFSVCFQPIIISQQKKC